MAKKIIIIALIPSLFIYLTGCYSMYDISKEELKTTAHTKLFVMTTKGDSYLFQNNSYLIRQDTLFGRSTIENQSSIKKSIPLSDIYALQTEKLNGGATVLVVVGTAVVIACVGMLLFVNTLKNDLKPN